MTVVYEIAEKYLFDPETAMLSCIDGKEKINLRGNESRLLLCFVENPSVCLSQSQLYDFVWKKQGFEVDYASMTQAVSLLRKIFNDSTKYPEYIKTYPRQGYKFIAGVKLINFHDDEENDPVTIAQSVVDIIQQASSTIPQSEINEDGNGVNNCSLPNKLIMGGHKYRDYLSYVFLLLPVLVYLWTLIYTPNMNKASNINDIDIYALNQNFDAVSVMPTIKDCISQFVKRNPRLHFERFIVTADKQSSISINALIVDGKVRYTKSVVLLSSNNDFSAMCKE